MASSCAAQPGARSGPQRCRPHSTAAVHPSLTWSSSGLSLVSMNTFSLSKKSTSGSVTSPCTSSSRPACVGAVGAGCGASRKGRGRGERREGAEEQSSKRCRCVQSRDGCGRSMMCGSVAAPAHPPGGGRGGPPGGRAPRAQDERAAGRAGGSGGCCGPLMEVRSAGCIQRATNERGSAVQAGGQGGRAGRQAGHFDGRPCGPCNNTQAIICRQTAVCTHPRTRTPLPLPWPSEWAGTW